MIFGGVSAKPQIEALSAGVDLVIATPGRLLDHMQSRAIDLSKIEMLVLDEGDRMLDMGFIRAIRRIIAALPQPRQSLLFSATFSDDIRALAHPVLRHRVLTNFRAESEGITTDSIVDELLSAVPVPKSGMQ